MRADAETHGHVGHSHNPLLLSVRTWGHAGICISAALRAVSSSPPHPSQKLRASNQGVGVKLLGFEMRWLEKPQGSIKQLLHGSGFDVWGWGSQFRGWGLQFWG